MVNRHYLAVDIKVLALARREITQASSLYKRHKIFLGTKPLYILRMLNITQL
jgi:hypothetical protein